MIVSWQQNRQWRARVAMWLTAAVCALSLCHPLQALDPNTEFFQYQFISPGPEAKLPTDVLDVAIDHNGFLWFATARGLAKFDGAKSTYFRVARHPGVLSNNPRRLFVDQNNRLFIASKAGLSMYDGQTFTPVLDDGKVIDTVSAFAQGSDGTLWFGRAAGVWELDGIDANKVQFSRDISNASSLLWHSDKLYIGSRGVVYVVQGEEIIGLDLPTKMADADVRDLIYHNGQVWGGTHKGMFVLEAEGALPIEHEPIADISVDVMLSDSDNTLWFGGESALGRIKPNGDIDLPPVQDDTFGFNLGFTGMIEDPMRRHWHTGRTFGVVGMTDNPVTRWSFSEGLQSTIVTAVAKDNTGAIYVGSDSGISVLLDDTLKSIVDEEFSPDGLINAITLDNDKRLWVGTQTALRAFDLDTQKWVEVAGGDSIGAAVNAIQAGADGVLWVATDVGLYQLRDQQLSIELDVEAIAVKSLLIDRNGTLWLGTDSGIASFNGTSLESHAQELPENIGEVIALSETAAGNIVAITADNGIFVGKQGQWQQHTEAEGIPEENLIDIELSGDDAFLITSGGIFRSNVRDLENESDKAITFSALLSPWNYRSTYLTPCCRGTNASAALLHQGRLVSATEDGIIVFEANAADVGGAPPPFIDTVTFADTTVLSPGSDSIALPSDVTNLKINYSAVDLERGATLHFRYRLRGRSDTWIDNGDARSVWLQSLLPGNYTFEIQASAVKDQWHEDSAVLTFSRAAKFTETAWFDALILAAALTGVLTLIWMKTSATRKRHNELEVAIVARTDELNALNNQLNQTNEELKQASQTDALTGLINRRFFEVLDPEECLAERVGSTGLMIMIDIDFFKRVNDAYGHAAGDAVLIQFADVLRAVTRQTDLIARWGGEEFLMIVHCGTDKATQLLDRLNAAVRAQSFTLPDGRRIQITSSIGAIQYPLWQDVGPDNQFKILVDFADAALYIVKMSGRDGWALLEGGQNNHLDLLQCRAGPSLDSFIHNKHLAWRASRPDIKPAFEDTITRLSALKPH